MAVVPGHHHAVRELRPVSRARLFLAGERFKLDIFVAGIFSEAPQVGVKGFCGVHAGVWGRAGRSAAEGGGPACSNQGRAVGVHRREGDPEHDRYFRADDRFHLSIR